MNRELIDLERNSNATCVIVKTGEYRSLTPAVAIDADTPDKYLPAGEKPFFADMVDLKCKINKNCYFTIVDIDRATIEEQNRFVSLVKDRELYGYNLPKNCTIVLTVRNEDLLKNISPDLYHFSVIAI